MERLSRFFGGGTDHQPYAEGTLLTVYGDREMALPILRRYDGRLQNSAGDVSDSAVNHADKITLREERLKIDKQPVEAGEVRLGKEVISEQQSVDVPVSHEEVYVSRRPVSEGEYSGDVGEIGDDHEVVVPVMREEISVDKRPIATEEVGLNKRNVQETQTVAESIRKERATIETDGDIEDHVTST